MNCIKCGKELRDGAKFCTFCGARQETSQPEQAKNGSENIDENREQRIRMAENRAANSGAAGRPSGGAPGGGTGLTLAAKIIIPVAIAVVAVAGVMAAVTLRAPKQETAVVSEADSSEDKDSKDDKKSESSKTKKEEASAASEASSAASETASAAAQSSSAETAAVSEPSGGEITEQEAAHQVIAALKRPSFFDRTDVNYALAEEPSVPEYTIESGLSNVTNLQYYYLSDDLKATLEKYGFAVFTSQSKEFFSVYEENRYNLLPNFVTVDSMMHSYHLYFSYLLRTTEKNYLKDLMGELSKYMFKNSKDQLTELKGSEWEEAALINAAYFAVGCKLTGLDVTIPDEIAAAVDEELSLVMNAEGMGDSPIFGQIEDYSQYAPRGYYEGDDDLEAYFRTMMWYGRRNFTQKEEVLDRSALLITLALDENALPLWEEAYMITSFFAGASDDNGYYEYRPVIDEFFGTGASAADLVGADEAWTAYHEYTAALKAPQINSVPEMDTGGEEDLLEKNAGFRFMGQRFSIDAAIFQNLMYSKIAPASDGSQRMLPNALDIPAAMGSDEALTILEEMGEDKYPNYLEKLNELRSGMELAPDTVWSASLYSRWLYTLKPLLEEKGEGWPMFMQSSQWLRKNLQTFLGSYTELKHDTVLYAKQAMAEMGGDEIEEKDDRGYVEPEPEVYARLSVLTEATITGLSDYGILDDADRENLEKLKSLADQLTVISEKELRNETLSDSEYDLIRSYGGQLEHFWQEAYRDETDKPNTFEFPAGIVTDVATDPNGSCLELGTGNALRIYVIAPVAGELKLCTGTVFSFYQFEQPLSERLTDTEWRFMMGIYYDSNNNDTQNRKSLEAWTDGFIVERS